MEKQKDWVDYKKIKSTVTMEMALKHYNAFEDLNVVEGKNALGCCPIHQGTNKRQFSVYLAKSIWRCFGSCNAGGNVLDFVSMMEGGISIRDAALLLQRLFMDDKDDEPVVQAEKKPERKPIKKDRKPVTETEEINNEEKEVNLPLKFTLKSLQKEHPFFEKREIYPETVEHFGLGFCTKGMMKQRIAIPIHNHEGDLIAYCGRSILEEQDEKEGKYKMPRNFVRSEVVYNLHRQKQTETQKPLVLVEDFFSVINAYQHGFTDFVAIMGSNLGKGQEEAIFRHLGRSGKLLLLFSTSEYSQTCADEILNRFSGRLFVKKKDISTIAETPYQLTAEELESIF